MLALALRWTSACLILLSFAAPLRAQTIDDGIMLKRHVVFAGNVYSHDTWDEYWEGTLKRDSGNIGMLKRDRRHTLAFARLDGADR